MQGPLLWSRDRELVLLRDQRQLFIFKDEITCSCADMIDLSEPDITVLMRTPNGIQICSNTLTSSDSVSTPMNSENALEKLSTPAPAKVRVLLETQAI